MTIGEKNMEGVQNVGHIGNVSISPRLNASTPITVEEELGGNMGIVNLILTSENCSNSSFSFPQNNPNAWSHPSGMNNTIVGLGSIDQQNLAGVDASFGNLMFPDTTRNSLNQFQPPSFPMLVVVVAALFTNHFQGPFNSNRLGSLHEIRLQ
ncbi:hypothetical protein VNO80_23247 [Phaseolus coccineus]|uniref:Uncharacterized protein n=1 Tax=Phaseolus coccineus TaxID=3886 RepID=A0AAN9MC23_PHACN